MADWTFTPTYAHVIRRDPPRTLISRYEDGNETRRQKHSTFLRRFDQRHEGLTASEASSMVTFYDGKGLLTSFSIVTYDPSEAAATEATVRFAEPLTMVQVAPDVFDARVRFVEVVS